MQLALTVDLEAPVQRTRFHSLVAAVVIAILGAGCSITGPSGSGPGRATADGTWTTEVDGLRVTLTLTEYYYSSGTTILCCGWLVDGTGTLSVAGTDTTYAFSVSGLAGTRPLINFTDHSASYPNSDFGHFFGDTLTASVMKGRLFGYSDGRTGPLAGRSYQVTFVRQ